MSSRYSVSCALDSECGRDGIGGKWLIGLLRRCNFCPGTEYFLLYEKIEHERKHRITGVVIDNEEFVQLPFGVYFFILSFSFNKNKTSAKCRTL